MRKHEFYYNSQPKDCTKYVSLSIFVIFCLTVTTFALLQLSNFYSDQPTVVRILMNSFESSETKDSQNLKDQKDSKINEQDLFKQIIKQQKSIAERQSRAASDNKTNSTKQKSNSYYEEQNPVIVYARTDTDSSIAERQLAEIPPQQDTDEEDPFSKIYQDDVASSDDYDYDYGQQELRPQPAETPYRQQQQESAPNYYRQQQSYDQEAAASPQYYDDSREDYSGTENKQHNLDEARSSQYHDYYRKYPYATPRPLLASLSGNNGRLAANHNMQLAIKPKIQQQNGEPYPTYMDDYDYLSSQSHTPAPQQTLYTNRKTWQQMPQYRNPSTALAPEEKQETAQQMDLLTMFKSIKTMWDLYQSFTSSWNTLAERRNREEQMAKQKYKQQQQQQQRIRINSKKPPRFDSGKNATAATKSPKKQTTTTSTTVTPSSYNPESYKSSEQDEQDEVSINKQPLAKVEPRKTSKREKIKVKDMESFRNKRQAANGIKERTDVGEGRYIKGDPLKGYYDFVITEGSYKFWAAFQVGTAILIIYSTFAAIYYSKVNPLVSDYDYTDYLGGARSLSGDDADFIDDDDELKQKSQSKNWLEWLPRTGHSLKFILDAIDKLPTDHAAAKRDNKSSYQEESYSDNENTEGIEYNDETEPPTAYKNSKQPRHTNESDASETSYDLKQDNRAM